MIPFLKSELSFQQFKNIIGPRVFRFLVISTLLGLLWFAVESTFVLVFQNLLVALGLVKKELAISQTLLINEMTGAFATFFAFGVTRTIVTGLKNYFMGITYQAFIRHSREELARMAFVNSQKIPAYQLISSFNESSVKASYWIRNLSGLLIGMTSTLAFSIASFYVAPREFLICVTFLLFLFLPLRKLNTKVRALGSSVNQEFSKITQSIVEGFRNYPILRVYQLLKPELEQSLNLIRNYEGHFKAFYKVSAIKSSMPILAATIIISAVSLVSKSYFATSSMTLVSFLYLFLKMTQGLSEINLTLTGMMINEHHFLDICKIHKTMASANIAEIDTEAKSRKDIANKDVFELTAKNLYFSYIENQPLLKNINIKLKKNDILFIQGPSGRGKSTLLQLLIGQLRPTSGEVLINNVNLTEQSFDPSDYIGYVGPEPFLVSGTVKENLIYPFQNQNQWTDNQIWNALKAANIDLFIRELPDQLHFHIDEKAQLSTGQKQRIALARAILRNPSLLILDEATSNLDYETENEIIENLKVLSQNRTTLIVSHRDSFMKIANQHLSL